MADIKGGPNPLFLREEELRQAMELLFFAYRDFTGEPDKILVDYGFGRAHHRVIYFVRSEEHTSELQSLMRMSYAVFCLKKQNNHTISHTHVLNQHHI